MFPPATSIVLAAVYQENVALPDAVKIIRAVLEKLKLPVRYEEYRVREQGQARASGETSLIIHGRSGVKPQIYVDEKLLEGSGEDDAVGISRQETMHNDRQASRLREEPDVQQSSETAEMTELVSLFERQFGQDARDRVNAQIQKVASVRKLSWDEATIEVWEAARQRLAASPSTDESVAPGPSAGRATGSSAPAAVQRETGRTTGQPNLTAEARALKARFDEIRQKALRSGLQWPAHISDAGFQRMAADRQTAESTLEKIQENLRRQHDARRE